MTEYVSIPETLELHPDVSEGMQHLATDTEYAYIQKLGVAIELLAMKTTTDFENPFGVIPRRRIRNNLLERGDIVWLKKGTFRTEVAAFACYSTTYKKCLVHVYGLDFGIRIVIVDKNKVSLKRKPSSLERRLFSRFENIYMTSTNQADLVSIVDSRGTVGQVSLKIAMINEMICKPTSDTRDNLHISSESKPIVHLSLPNEQYLAIIKCRVPVIDTRVHFIANTYGVEGKKTISVTRDDFTYRRQLSEAEIKIMAWLHAF